MTAIGRCSAWLPVALLVIAASMLALVSCTSTDDEEYSVERFYIKQVHGHSDALTDAYLSEFPSLDEYLTEPPQIIVDWGTSIAEDIDYSNIYLRSFASPTIYMANIDDCGPMDDDTNHIFRNSPYVDFECYDAPDCSAVMISPRVLMTAGHCPCVGFGLSVKNNLPIDTEYDDQLLNVVFRSYLNIGQQRLVPFDQTDPDNYTDESFSCRPIYVGWTGFDDTTNNCSNQFFDIAFYWCAQNDEGAMPGDKYGFVDYEVDHFRDLLFDGRRVVSVGYPSRFPTAIMPLDRDEVFHSIWQNPVYIDNYWNRQNPLYPASVWNRDNAWPMCNYIWESALCDTPSFDPFNYVPGEPEWEHQDYILFYGHKLISEGTSYVHSDSEVRYKMYKQHGGSGSPVFSGGGKLVSGPARAFPAGYDADLENRGMESPAGPGMVIYHDAMPKVLYNYRHVFDSDRSYVFDFIETGSWSDLRIQQRTFTFLPLHDWHVRRGVWTTYNQGSLFWDGNNLPFSFWVPRGRITKIPFGVLNSYRMGTWEFFFNPWTGELSIDYLPPDPETNLATQSWAVKFKPNSKYGVVVKYINTSSPFFYRRWHGTWAQIGAQRYKLHNRGEFETSYTTLFFETDASTTNFLRFLRQGYGKTLIEEVSVHEIQEIPSDINGSGLLMSMSFDYWDEREVWSTANFRHSLFWNVKRANAIGWAGVLLSTGNPTVTENLTTSYIPIKNERDYMICLDSTSTRDGPVDIWYNNIGITIELRDANNTSRIIDTSTIASIDVGYLDEGYYLWHNGCVTLDTRGGNAYSYMLMIRRQAWGLPTVLVDNLSIHELPAGADYYSIDAVELGGGLSSIPQISTQQ